MNLPDRANEEDEMPVSPMLEAQAAPPWAKFAGIFKDNQDFAEIMDELRAERESDDESEIDPSYYLSPRVESSIGPDEFWADVMARIQAEKDAMGDEEINPDYYRARDSEV
jgi:hypothetical protein